MFMFSWKKEKKEEPVQSSLTQDEVVKVTAFCEKMQANDLLSQALQSKTYSEAIELLLNETISFSEKLVSEYKETFNAAQGSGSEEVTKTNFKDLYECLTHITKTQNLTYKQAVEIAKVDYPELFLTAEEKLRKDKGGKV